MAKINRYGGNLQAFGSNAQGTERTVFGDTTQDDTLDANITTEFLRGWGIVGVNENPTKQDFNALGYTVSQLVAYLHQAGVPEWHVEQEYFEGAVTITQAGVYRSLVDGNIGNDPDTDDGSNWLRFPVITDLRVSTLSDLQALDTSGANEVYMAGRSSVGDGSEGHFRWDSSDLSTEVGNDEVTAGEGDGGIYIAPDSDKTGASGAWVRQGTIDIPSLEWWGLRQSDIGVKTPTEISNILSAAIVNGNPARFLSSDQSISVTVGTDVNTIGDAMRLVPYNRFHEFSVSIADGTYDEDVIIPVHYAPRALSTLDDPTTGARLAGVSITGNSSTPTNVKFRSLFAAGGQTYRMPVEGFELTNDGPSGDVGATMEARRGTELSVRNVRFRSADAAQRIATAYGGIITVKEGVDIGTNVYSGGFVAKVGGHVYLASNDPTGNPNTGSVTGNFANAQDGFVFIESDADAGTPFEFAQFDTDPSQFVSAGGYVGEWEGGEPIRIFDTKLATEEYGEVTDTTDSNGDITIPHGLYATPVAWFGTVVNDNYYLQARTAGINNIRFRVHAAGGGAVASTSVTVHWLAKVAL